MFDACYGDSTTAQINFPSIKIKKSSIRSQRRLLRIPPGLNLIAITYRIGSVFNAGFIVVINVSTLYRRLCSFETYKRLKLGEGDYPLRKLLYPLIHYSFFYSQQIPQQS